MKSAFYYIIIFCLLVGCTNPGRRVVLPDSWQQDTLSYAQGLTIGYTPDYVQVDVRDPWDTTQLLQRYLLVDRNQPVPEGLPKGTVVKVPVQRVVV